VVEWAVVECAGAVEGVAVFDGWLEEVAVSAATANPWMDAPSRQQNAACRHSRIFAIMRIPFFAPAPKGAVVGRPFGIAKAMPRYEPGSRR